MRHFSIKELENFSEVKSHTIRVWEQRYNILVALRRDSSHRYYTLQQVEALLNYSLLTKNGTKISSLIKLNKQEIQLRVKGLETPEAKKNKAINFLIVKMFSNEIEDFENILNNWTLSFGIDSTIQSI
ncbi:MAG: MerR family transcriptional regulator, partial [Segetibacter sp.]